jgi:hypothetical protein
VGVRTAANRDTLARDKPVGPLTTSPQHIKPIAVDDATGTFSIVETPDDLWIVRHLAQLARNEARYGFTYASR